MTVQNGGASRLFLLLCYLTLLSYYVDAHRCFVCIPSVKKNDNEVLSLVKDFFGETIQNCEDFSESDRESFIKECPEDSIGCLTQFQGRTFLRSCARVGVDICKEANNVTYCYCSKNECNTPERRLADPPSYVGSFEDNELIDDEDHFESSGGSGSSTFSDDSEEEDYNSLEEDITELPPAFIPRFELETRNISITQVEGSGDNEIVFVEDYIFEEEDEKEVEEEVTVLRKNDVSKSPAKESSSSSVLRPTLLLSLLSIRLCF